MQTEFTEIRSLRIAQGAAIAATILLALVSLTGWLTGALVLASGAAAFIPMAPVTAMVFLALSGVLLFRTRVRPPRGSRAVLAAAGVVGVVVVAELLDVLAGLPISPDRLFVSAAQRASALGPGRMSPVTAGAFLLLAAALAFFESPSALHRRGANRLSLVVSGVAFVLLVGYVYNAPFLYGGSVQPVALPTSIGLLLVGLATAAQGPEHWPFSAFTGDSVRALLTRQLVPLAVTPMIVVALIEAATDRLGYHERPAVLAVFVMLSVAVVTATVFRVTGTIGTQLDAARAARIASQELLIQSQRAAAVGHYVFIVPEVRWTSSAVLDEIFGIGEDYDRSVDGWMQIIHADDREQMLAYLQGHVLGEGKPFEREYRIRRIDDGAERWVRGLGELEFDESGAPVKMFGVIQDITERKLAELEVLRVYRGLEQIVAERTSQLKAANQELESFSYSVSHDLRAPLRHVSGFVQLLTEREGDRLDDKGRHYLETISDSVRHMGILIDDLLQFSRFGRAELELGDVDMDALVQEALDQLGSETQGRDIEWDIQPLPHVRGDRGTLQIVWTNLIGNAVKYTQMRSDARIAIGSREEEDATVFFVQDDGVGFDMAYAGKLFGVFQRLHSASDFEGTGIGLANVNRVIARHGGTVWAEAEVDKGATFFFSIPKERG